MTEADLHKRVVSFLRAKKLLFCHVPNGGPREKKWARAGRSFGIYPGVPDLLIFTPTETFVGVALELKTKRGKVSPAQERWLSQLRDARWLALVADDYDKIVTFINTVYP